MPDILISENITGPAIDRLAARFDLAYMPDLWKDPKALAEHSRSRASTVGQGI